MCYKVFLYCSLTNSFIIKTRLQPDPVRFILPESVSYLGERGVLCVGNGSHFCTPVLMNMCNITFQVLRLGTFVFNKSSEKKIFTLISVVKSLVGIMLAKRRRRWPSMTSALGQCIVLSAVSGAGMLKRHQQQSQDMVQSPNAVTMTGQRRRRRVNIDTALAEFHVFAQGIQQTGR